MKPIRSLWINPDMLADSPEETGKMLAEAAEEAKGDPLVIIVTSRDEHHEVLTRLGLRTTE